MGHILHHANFSILDNNVLVKPVYVKVLQERENKHRVVEFFNTLPFSSFGKYVAMNLSSLADFL